jgi:hypothetical protein
MNPITIDDENAIRLVEELAALEGESVVTVVINAVREKLERERVPEINQARVRRFLELGRRYREAADPGSLARDPFDDLYDEDGLPR